MWRIYSFLVFKLLHAIFGFFICYDSSSQWGIINLSLHLHPPPFTLSCPVFSRRLNDNEISSLDAMGAFKKLPNLRKMYVDAHFPIFTLRVGVWGGGGGSHMGHLAVSFMSITLCVMSHVGGVDRKSGRMLGRNGRRHSGIYCLAIFATHSRDGENGGLLEKRPVIYQAWNCLCYSAVELITDGKHLKVPLLTFYRSTDCNQLVNH